MMVLYGKLLESERTAGAGQWFLRNGSVKTHGPSKSVFIIK